MLLQFLVAAMATWRISAMLFGPETGPLDIFAEIRGLAARHLFTAELFSCMGCLSVWVGIGCTIVMLTPAWIVLLPFALSTFTIGVERCLSARPSK